eukprot:UN17799
MHKSIITCICNKQIFKSYTLRQRSATKYKFSSRLTNVGQKN